MRLGIGYDIHRLIPTIKRESIFLGGIAIPCYYRIQAHSDGDVLLHALTDACLGALALGDIGQWFSDTDPKNSGRSSTEFLKIVLQEIHKYGYQVKQVDSNVFLEEPKLAPHHDEIRQNMAKVLEIELTQISLKAKTMEGLGPVGERKAISAQVIVQLQELADK
ncbi:MAG: 2-C-methyl-D-erythritol 2,4-cyclodiphosphate synthase [Proteobacteria bacterium]|nr:2-C-methyl-D-erythritol 2,4-cyclodiphosphate synthase [Pseudomonadota bacterium]NDC23818.1 2-C-methyl-D-erythritol 2,4-cyclodiphosphate synthase [Pseudomonadota bacterium]NDD03983.1 2-C-methyl-D-erythritol 2,4-cyclodiphosphate synthase [Pseudomonadota bacterium]NDG27016.1 2-C-methyl-D-erythritol 2,4-cyclodiphosphate synthase [Pseudomonadota bacterium]